MIATLSWEEGAVNALAFLALCALVYVLPRALKEGIGARWPTILSVTVWLGLGAVSRINLAADEPVSWWSDVTTYVQPFAVAVFLVCLTVDSAHAVKRWREALELIYSEMGQVTGDRVAAIIRAVRR